MSTKTRKALSLTQPMAWAIFHGKNIENRTWPTNYRGRVIIHASKKFDLKHWCWIEERQYQLFGRSIYALHARDTFKQGALIGEVDIVDCVRGHGSRWAFSDQWNWVLENPELYDLAIPYKGHLGLFNVDMEEVEEIRQRLLSFRV